MKLALASIIHLLLLNTTDFIKIFPALPLAVKFSPPTFFIIISLLCCRLRQLFSLKLGPQSHDETQRNSASVIHS